jgi:hypothetical protein
MEKLDTDILRWIADETQDGGLSAQIELAEVSRRDYMRTGFFVYFQVLEGVAKINASVRPVCPHIASPDLMDGAGCTLFIREGYVHYLEIYARGGFFPESLEHYELKTAAAR